MVWALGAFLLISTARMPNSITCTEAPAAYQNGPATPVCTTVTRIHAGTRRNAPYFQATLLDCSRVAAQVHWLHTTSAMRPVLTERPGVENRYDV